MKSKLEFLFFLFIYLTGHQYNHRHNTQGLSLFQNALRNDRLFIVR